MGNVQFRVVEVDISRVTSEIRHNPGHPMTANHSIVGHLGTSITIIKAYIVTIVVANEQ